MHNKLLVIGLDPGTTVGYAVLDTNGKAILIGSDKNAGMSEIIEKIIPLGSILFVGTDKSKTPGFVEKFSASNGAKIVNPRYDLSVDEKRKSIRNFDVSLLGKTRNDHEVDALASAIFAYNAYSFLFKKIRKFVESNNAKDKADEIIKEVIINKVSMKEALFRRLKNDISAISFDANNESKNKIIAETNPMNELRRRIKYLENYNEFLKNNLEKKKTALLRLKLENNSIINAMDITSSNKAKNLLKNKNYIINNLISENKSIRKQVLDFQKENSSLKNFLRSKEYVPIIKIESLGKLKENIIDLIKNEEVLFVNDPGIISPETLSRINPSVIIYKKKPSSKINCICIRAEDLDHISFEDFVLVKKKELDAEINKKKTLIEIVDKYKNRFRND